MTLSRSSPSMFSAQDDRGRAMIERSGLFSLGTRYEQDDGRRLLASGCAAVLRGGVEDFDGIAHRCANAAAGLAALHAVAGDLYTDPLKQPSLSLFVTHLLEGRLTAAEWASCARSARPIRASVDGGGVDEANVEPAGAAAGGDHNENEGEEEEGQGELHQQHEPPSDGSDFDSDVDDEVAEIIATLADAGVESDAEGDAE